MKKNTSKPWFDPQTGLLCLDEYVAKMPSYRKILADGVVTKEELAEQAQRVTELFKRLEAALPPSVKDTATEALCELAVLNALHHHQPTHRG